MRIPASILRNRLVSLVSLFLFFAFLSVKPSIAASPEEQVRVLAHLPLEGMHVNQMFVQQRGNKYYLYLHRPGKNAFALVDVTKPDKPVLLSRNALKETSRAQVEPPAGGSVLAIAVTPEGGQGQGAPAAKLPTETVQLVDMSNPKGGKTIKTFKGVTSMYPDDARKLVYLVNDEGLWVVSHRMNRPLPLCTSESDINPMPDCQ
jgi:hypothetical protein